MDAPSWVELLEKRRNVVQDFVKESKLAEGLSESLRSPTPSAEHNLQVSHIVGTLL